MEQGYSQLDKLTATFGTDIDNFCDIDPVHAPSAHLDAAKLAPGLGDLIKIMVDRYKAKTGASDVPPHVSMGFNQTWILLQSVLPVAIQKYGGTDAEAIRKAALDVDIPVGGTIQGYGVKFFPPGTELSGQNERSTPVVMQYVKGADHGRLADRDPERASGSAVARPIALRDELSLHR